MIRRPLITCDSLGFINRGFLSFQDISMSFLSGGFVALYGSSGVGSSSLLRIMNGSIKPTSGIISINESTTFIDSATTVTSKRRKVVEQLKNWAQGDDEIIDIAAEHFGLHDILDAEYYILPPGLRKRVSMARLLITRAKIWLLDRPLEQLDEAGADMLVSAMASRINNEGLVICALGVERNLDYFEKSMPICLDDYQT